MNWKFWEKEKLEKIQLKTFVREHFLPLIDEMIGSELDLLQKDVRENNPSIDINKSQLNFEMFLLALNVSGRSLSKIKGFDSQAGLEFVVIVDEVFKEKFGSIELSPRWLDGGRGAALSDTFNYYKNKTTAYHVVELEYNNGNIDKECLHKKLSEIFFSVNPDSINEHLRTAIGELHKGMFFVLLQKLSEFSQKHQIVSEFHGSRGNSRL